MSEILSVEEVCNFKLEKKRGIKISIGSKNYIVELDSLPIVEYTYILSGTKSFNSRSICPHCKCFVFRPTGRFRPLNSSLRPGVYFLLNKLNYPIYIGETAGGYPGGNKGRYGSKKGSSGSNRVNRLRDHLYRFYECIASIRFFDCLDRKEIEKACINYWDPILNVQSRRKNSENCIIKDSEYMKGDSCGL
jgi:hypothetical protein